MKKGQYLKEVIYSFQIKGKLNINKVKIFLKLLIDKMNMQLISIKVNKLAPGFDIYCGIKESIIYLGYWGEYNFVRLFVFSCKKFNDIKIAKLITKNFDLITKIKVEVLNEHKIKKELETLWK